MSFSDENDGLLPYDIGYGECIKESHKDTGKPGALLVKFETDKELWIPKSVVHDDSEVRKEGQVGDVVVHAWWGEQNVC
jgi:3-methyladenine DNA glycosylase AlkC